MRIHCTHCRSIIAERTLICPYCGHLTRRGWGCLGNWALLLGIGIVFLAWASGVGG